MGVGAVEVLLADPDVDVVGVGDARPGVASRLPQHDKLQPMVVLDIEDHEAVIAALGGFDVVVNAVGPYFRHGTRVLDAAIGAGVDYVDLCDDLEPTRELLARSTAARDAGITAVIGCGTSPGASNMMVAAAADSYDVLLEARISWIVPMQDSGGLAVGLHSLHMLTGPVYRVEDGVGTFGVAGERSHRVSFPDPYGEVVVVEVGHPEPYTLHQQYPSLRTTWNSGAVYPDWAMHRLRAAVQVGLADDEPIRVGGIEVLPGRVAIALDARFRDRNPDLPLGPELSYARVDTVGELDGVVVSDTYLAPDRMSEGAGGGGAVAAGLVARGETKERGGVFAPEAAFVPDRYFGAMARAGLHVVRWGEADDEPMQHAAPVAGS
jgi:saccharopine dehydrogenase (NAD+, L-lysine-forming)